MNDEPARSQRGHARNYARQLYVEPEGIAHVRAWPVTRELFVFRVHPDHNDDDIKNFLNDQWVDVTAMQINRISGQMAYAVAGFPQM